jgi:N-methylhydantoinase B
MGGKMLYNLPPGTMVVMENAGGGGYGDPLDRDPESVQRDVINELVSPRSAFEYYGVVIDPETLKIDYEETKARRRAR